MTEWVITSVGARGGWGAVRAAPLNLFFFVQHQVLKILAALFMFSGVTLQKRDK